MASLSIDSPGSLKDLVGQVVVTDWLTVTQERIRQYADATGDHQWIHVDVERAKKESPYGSTIAHGFLTLSLLSYFMKEAIQIRNPWKMAVNYGLNRVRFPSAVRAGSQIRGCIRLQTTKEVSKGIEVIFSVVVECQGQSKPCCVAEWIVRYYME